MNCLTITLNPALDTTYVVPSLETGGVNRVLRMHVRPGGKGSNVARILAANGHAVATTGFLGGEAGQRIEEGLRAAGVRTHFQWLAHGESRTCHAILDEAAAVATEVLEAGPCIDEAEMTALLDTLPRLVTWADMVVVAGSAPPGTTPGFLEALARIVRTGSPRYVLDAGGGTFQALVTGRPDLFKPNEAEIAQLMGGPAPLDDQIGFIQDDLIRSWMAPGARVIYSRGRHGALLVTGASVLRAESPQIRVVNTVGCGDALLAGFLAAWHNGASDDELVRTGVATGTAAALQEAAGEVDPGDVARFLDAVEVSSYTPGV